MEEDYRKKLYDFMSSTGMDNTEDDFYSILDKDPRRVYDKAREFGLDNSYEDFYSKITSVSPQAPQRVDVSDVENADTKSSSVPDKPLVLNENGGWSSPYGSYVSDDIKPKNGKPTYQEWVKTVPNDRIDERYDLQTAYDLGDFNELEAWRKSSLEDLEAGKNHLRSAYYDPEKDEYRFAKRADHPTVQMEIDEYNANEDFKSRYGLDKSGDYYKYVPIPTEEEYTEMGARYNELKEELNKIRNSEAVADMGRGGDYMGLSQYRERKDNSERSSAIEKEMSEIAGRMDVFEKSDKGKMFRDAMQTRITEQSNAISEQEEKNGGSFWKKVGMNITPEWLWNDEEESELTMDDINLYSAKMQLKSAQSKLDLETMRLNGEMKGLAYLRGLANYNYEQLVSDINIPIGIARSVGEVMLSQKVNSGEKLTDSEQALLQANETNALASYSFDDNATLWERLGQLSPDLALYTLDFITGNVISGAGKAGEKVTLRATEKATEKAVERALAKNGGRFIARRAELEGLKKAGQISEEAAERLLKKEIAEAVAKDGIRNFMNIRVMPKVEGLLVSSTIQTLANPISYARMIKDFDERYGGSVYYDDAGNLHIYDDNKSIGMSLYQTIAAAWIENASEYSGALIEKGAGMLWREAGSLVGKGVSKIPKGSKLDACVTWLDNTMTTLKKSTVANVLRIPQRVGEVTQVQGAFGETAEEIVGAVGNILFATEQQKGQSYADSMRETAERMFSSDQMLETALSCVMMSVAMGGGSNAFNAVQRSRYKSQVNKSVETSKAMLRNVKGLNIEQLDSLIENNSLEEIASYMRTQAEENGWSGVEKGGVFNYVYMRARQIGVQQDDVAAVGKAQEEMRATVEDMTNDRDGNIYNAKVRNDNGTLEDVTIVGGRVYATTDSQGGVRYNPFASSATVVVRKADGTKVQMPSREIEEVVSVENADTQLARMRQTAPQLMLDAMQKEGVVPTVESVFGDSLIPGETQFENGSITYMGKADEDGYYIMQDNKSGKKFRISDYALAGYGVKLGLDELNKQAAAATNPEERATLNDKIQDANDDAEYLEQMEALTKDNTQESWGILQTLAKSRVKFDDNGTAIPDESNADAMAYYLLSLTQGSYTDAINGIDKTIEGLVAPKQKTNADNSVEANVVEAANNSTTNAATKSFYEQVKARLAAMQQQRLADEEKIMDEAKSVTPVSEMKVGETFLVQWESNGERVEATAKVVGETEDGEKIVSVYDADENVLPGGSKIYGMTDEQWDALRVQPTAENNEEDVVPQPEPTPQPKEQPEPTPEPAPQPSVKIPRDKNGNINHAELNPTDTETYNAAVNEEADNAIAFAEMGDDGYVSGNLEAARKEVEKANAKTPKATGAAQRKAEIDKINAERNAAANLVTFWENVQAEIDRRAAEQNTQPNETPTEEVNASKEAETQEERDKRLEEERKQRILSEGTVFDKPFGLVPVREKMTVDDIDTNINRIVSGLKTNEGNEEYNGFYGFAYQGNFKENAGQQVHQYFYSLGGVVPTETLNAWMERHGIKSKEDIVEYGKRLYAEETENVPDWVDDTAQAARDRGFRMVNGERVGRQLPVQGIEGNEVTVKFSSKDSPQGRWKVVDAGSLQPSHKGRSRNPQFFITEAQPKERTDDASDSASTQIAQNINPEEITEGVTAYTGSPVINARGEVLQGNNRTIALQKMYNSFAESSEKYKQYLIDHAAEFGIDPQAIAAMENPVLVRQIDVDDDTAIKLGQMTAQDTESGGVQRIDPQRTKTSLGERFSSFVNKIFEDTDEEVTIGEALDKNGKKALYMLWNWGIINNTQYQSALNKSQDITPEAKNDLRLMIEGILYENAPDNLRQRFDMLPKRTQTAVLKTIYRSASLDNETKERLLFEIQQAIMAYGDIVASSKLMRDSKTVTLEQAANEIAEWLKQYDMLAPVQNSEKYSNFALELVKHFASVSQKTQESYFNQLYDALQGKRQEASLFDTEDSGEPVKMSFDEALKKVYGIDYKQSKQYDNGISGSNALGGNSGYGAEGQRGNEGDTGTGERETQGEQPADSGGRAEGDNSQGQTDGRGRAELDFDTTHIDEAVSEMGLDPEQFHTFFSNAARAVEAIKQEKATPEQWLAMLKKNGGLKKAEDKWLGLSQWLQSQDKKSLTKQEVLDFINENMVQVEEVKYSDNVDNSLDDEIITYWREATGNNYDKAEQVNARLVEKYGERFSDAAEVWYDGGLRVKDQSLLTKIVNGDNAELPINSTRLNYTTQGLQNKREIALTVPTIEPWNENDEIHFGDAGEGRAVAWVRFGETTDADGNRVLVIDEIQSKRHQEGREKGYRKEITYEDYEKAQEEWDGFKTNIEEKYHGYIHDIMNSGQVTEEEKAKYDRYQAIFDYIEKGVDSGVGVPNAPFERNWHELAMKRMLRYASENGFDKVAWTKGEQQASRYDLSKVIDSIECSHVGKNGRKMFALKGLDYNLVVDTDGTIVAGEDAFVGKPLSDIVGKPLAEKMIGMEEGDVVEGDGLRIGSEGMKGFYDKMLPSFMNKYGKQWGVKVGEVTLPNVEEAGRTMWAVDVTDAMRESVMQGQPMFLISKEDWNERVIAGQDLKDEANSYGHHPSFNFDYTVNLVHGTSQENAEKILKEGLQRGSFLAQSEEESKQHVDAKRKGNVFLTIKVDARDISYNGATNEYYAENGLVMDADGVWVSPQRKEANEKELERRKQTDEKQLAYNAVRQALANAGIEVVVATEEEVERLKAEMKTLQDSKGVVRGWVGNDGKIHLTKDGLNAETPIHEYTHLWAEVLQMTNPDLWEQIKGLLKGTPEWQRITSMKEYSNLKDDDRIAGEVLAHISGKKNAERMEAEAKRMIDEAPTLEEAAKAANLLGRMRDALKKFWTWVGKTLLGRKGNITIEQVQNMVLADLVNGVNPFGPIGGKRTNRTKRTDASVSEREAYNGKSSQERSDMQYEKASEILKALYDAGYKDFYISRSITDFGVSTYIQGMYGLKFRISDHSVTSNRRIMEEHFFTLNTPANSILDIVKEREEIGRAMAKKFDERKEKERLLDEKWERIKPLFEGLGWKRNDRTYQNFEKFSSNEKRSNILQTPISGGAFRYEWTEPIDAYTREKPSYEWLEHFDENENVVRTTELLMESEMERIDEAYMKAVESGDMETAQRMVNEAAKAAMPNTKVVDENGNPLVVYHGGKGKIIVFDKNRIGENLDYGTMGAGFYFTSDRENAENYARNAKGEEEPSIERVFINIRNIKEVNWNELDGDSKKKSETFTAKAIAKGYDGLTAYAPNGAWWYVAFNSNQIKSADPVTYDDEGNVIPLSQRFNKRNADIRFSIDDETDETDRADVPEMSDEETESYDAGSMTMIEVATDGVLKAAEKNKEDLRMRNEAVKAIGVSINRLRQAMAKQREYDKATVDSIVRLARMMIENGYMDNMSRSEVKRLMTLAKNATGKTDITKQANAVVDLMLKHQLKAAEAVQQKLLATKGSKVNASGVEVQAGLDITGQRTLKAMKEGIELDEAALTERIADVNDRMGGTDKTLAANAAEEYEGLMMAKDYHDMIRQSEQDEAQLRHELDQAKEDVKNGTLGRKDYKELAARIDAALRKNMAERVTAFTRLNQQLAEVLNGSKGRAREFREKQMERVREIQHNANSDMKGTPASEHKKAARINKVVNSGIVRFLFKPVATFDEMLRFFGKKSVDGMGYLWQRFMGGYIDAADTEWRSLKKDHDALDEKVSEVMGKKMRWSDLFSMERRMEPIEVEFYDLTTDEEGNSVRVKEKHPLTQGNALYIYMVNKMDDGAMKLRRMGISDEDVDRIAGQLDPRFLQLADWIQDEFLPKKREAFNAVHMRMLGAPMAAIEEYFPLVINSRSRGQEEDINDTGEGDLKISTITGSIIKRTVNTTALDITNADAFDVLLGHLRDMEHWAAFAEFIRDTNTLISYKHFRNQVLNMSSVRFGAGKVLWKNFKKTCSIAAGVYRPKADEDSIDNAIVNISKGVTSAKISFRLYTALKQLLSYPAYFSEANPVELAKSTVRPAASFNWALDNLPGFAERWQSRQAGDSRLKDTDADWDFWKNKFVDTARRWGMTPNAFVDGITVAMGAKAIYESKMKGYLKAGYSEAEAKEKALKEASAAVNETQQSSQNAYLSAMQLDRTVASVALTVFRNASMGYERRLLRAVDNIKRKFTKGYKEESIEFMRKKMVREGLTEEQAKAASERAWNISIAKDVANLVIFGFVMQLAWNLGSSLMYLVFGDDDDEKEAMWEDAAMHALAGPVEGLSGGNVISEVYNMARSGKKISNYNFQLLPIMSDLQTTMKHMEQDKVRGIQDIVNLVIQAGVGVNPQTITDAVVAIVDAADGDLGVGKEIGMLLLRISQVPQSQLDQLYIDELGMSAKDAKALPMEELAQRYAAYKRMKDAPLTGWAYSDEAREKVDKRYLNKFVKLVQERIANMDDEQLDLSMENKDIQLKKIVSKEVADRMDGKDSYGAAPSSSWKEETQRAHVRYQELRNYTDLCEDIMLQKAQADAEKAYDAALEADDIETAINKQDEVNVIKEKREEINNYRHQLEGEYDDNEVMELIRETRKDVLEELGLIGNKKITFL